jgi:anaerobic magnesium-protoporphyrin IX monomethyl ester cyclase
MKIALVHLNGRKIIEKTSHANAGLAYLGAYALNRGHEVLAVDARYEGIGNNEVARRIFKNRPDVLGISMKTPDVKVSEELAAVAKKKLSDPKIIVGGAHVTALQKRVLQECPYFDIGVVGEGEETFCEILDAFEQHRDDLSSIDGIVYRHNDGILETRRRDWIADLDELLSPAWELFPKGTDKSLFTSRGCPFRCIFCQRVMGSHIRRMSPERVVAEMLRNIEKYDCRFFQIEDDVFGANKQWVLRTLDLMMAAGIHKRAKWAANSRVNYSDLEVFTKMKQAGCVGLCFGIESGNQAILNTIRKDFTLKQASRAFQIAKKVGLDSVAFFIIGHPFETEDTIRDTINFACHLNPSGVCFGQMIPYPGTRIYEMARKGEGGYRGFHENWELYTKYFGKGLELENLSRSALNRYQKQAYIEFYVRNLRIKDFGQFLIKYLRTRFPALRPIQ